MDYENTLKTGVIGEANALSKFTQEGLNVSIPFTQNVPYDLIAEYKGILYKIQVKTTEKIKNDSMIFRTERSNGFNYKKELYTKEEIDYFFLYCIENEWCGLISIDDFNSTPLVIHYNSPLNNNYHNYRMFDDYDFSHRISELKTGEKVPLLKRENPREDVVNRECINTRSGEITREQLKQEIRENSFLQVGKNHGVTDNAIRKWCKKLGLPNKSYFIKRYTDDEWEDI